MTSPRSKLLLVALGCLIPLAFILHIGYGGSSSLSFNEILRELVRGPGYQDNNSTIVWMFRMPRGVACLLVGGILGVVGSGFQALFRNPLADPYIVGASSGASMGGVCAMLLGFDGILGVIARPVFGFLTGLATLALVFTLARRRTGTDVTDLLIAGTVTGSLLSAVQSLLILVNHQDTNIVLRWLLGSLSDAFWSQLAILAPLGIVGAFLLIREAKQLNALAIGEVTAGQLGVPVRRLRNTILLASTAMIAVCVGTFGNIGFLGLAAPHLARRIFGVDWRYSMLGSLLLGSLLLLAADGLSQKVLDLPGGLPVGLVTAVLGAPILLLAMRRKI